MMWKTKNAIYLGFSLHCSPLWKTAWGPGILAHDFNPNAQEAEAFTSLWIPRKTLCQLLPSQEKKRKTQLGAIYSHWRFPGTMAQHHVLRALCVFHSIYVYLPDIQTKPFIKIDKLVLGLVCYTNLGSGCLWGEKERLWLSTCTINVNCKVSPSSKYSGSTIQIHK